MVIQAPSRQDLAAAAHAEYRGNGYESIPIRLVRRGSKKRPEFPGGTWRTSQEIAEDPDRLAEAIRNGFTDVALVCGDVAALDFDARDGETPEQARERGRLAVERYGLAGAVLEQTAQGLHVLTRAPQANGTPWRKRAFKAPHLVNEVQVGEGALLFVAPSFHPVAQVSYLRVNELRDVDELPECPVELLRDPPPEPAAPPTPSPPRSTGRGDWSTLDVVGLFRDAGMYVRDLGDGKHGVRCPWAGEHTTGTDGTDTVVYVAGPTTGPGFKCLHAHCAGRDIRDVRAYFGTDAVDRWCVDDFRPDPAPRPVGIGGVNSTGSECDEATGEALAVVSVEDFEAYLPDHKYIHRRTRELWPQSSLDRALPKVRQGKEELTPSRWLDLHRPVVQMTWAPGEPEIIVGRLIDHGGWLEDPRARVFNTYHPPRIHGGDPEQAGPWIDHVRKVYAESAGHLIRWMAYKVQRPQEKVNHALVLGGAQGIGKDTLLEPVKYAVGPSNFQEIVPGMLLGRFNGFVESVVLRISEGHDLGDLDRYSFYERLKLYTAAPPDVIRVDKKYVPEQSVPNVCGVIITTNHKTSGIYLPADDRRHYVAWSDLRRDDFTPEYWLGLWGWYQRGGLAHVARYLQTLDLAGFNPKAPPPKTAAFWDIVDANRAPEDAELADALERLGNPTAVTVAMVIDRADPAFREWLHERRNRRQIPHRFETAGYEPVRNPSAQDGYWAVDGRRQPVYARRELSVRERIAAAQRL